MKNKSEKEAFSLLKDSSLRKTRFFSSRGTYLNFVFLCGKKKEPGDNRDQIATNIVNKKPFRYSVYSEDALRIFDDTELDLLKFEEVLANISSRIVILVESYGSACELGAFSFLDSGLNKLLVINDIAFAGTDSFIEKGPLKKIKESVGAEHVLYETFQKNGQLVFSQPLYDSLNNITRPTFLNDPFANESDNGFWVIKDVGLIACLLFEYVFRFGYIRDSSVLDAVALLTANFGFLPMKIRLPSGNEIDEDKTKKILHSLPRMLNAFGLLDIDSLKGESYYRLNPSVFRVSGEENESITSLLFHEYLVARRMMRSRFSRIKNLACKEGYVLWKSV